MREGLEGALGVWLLREKHDNSGAGLSVGKKADFRWCERSSDRERMGTVGPARKKKGRMKGNEVRTGNA